MLFSRRNIWAVANIICWGTQVDASSNRRRRDEAPPPKRQDNEYFKTNWELPLNNKWPLDVNQTINYTVIDGMNAERIEVLPLILLWTNGSDSLTTDNTWVVFEPPPYSCSNSTPDKQCIWRPGTDGAVNFGISLNPYEEKDIWQTGAYFLCFGVRPVNTRDQRCISFSGFFTLEPNAQALPALKPRQGASIAVPTTALQVTQTKSIVLPKGATPIPSATNGPVFAPSVSLVTNTIPTIDVTVTTVAPTPTGELSSASPSKAKSGLPMGAIIGIAVGGAAILIAILILAFLCYRRRRRTQTPSEQVLLADNMTHHPHSLEKLEVDLDTSDHGASGGMLGSILETRPSSGPYDHVQSSAPYSGTIGPNRKTASTQLSVSAIPTPLARGVSDASAHTPVSPRSTIPGNDARSLNRRSVDARSISIYDEPYQDVPLYGDARHVPQMYSGRDMQFASQSPTPFLSEPGMSQEEIERLEEEERRIDAAIAEAERRR